jgi:hypothetical protein
MIEETTSEPRINGQKSDGRFKSGNPGRPRGSRGKAAVLAEKLAAKDITEIVNVLVTAAKDGCTQSAALLLARLWVPPKSRHVTFPMPEIRTVDDIAGALSSLWAAVSSGAITVDEMLALCAVLERHADIIHAQDHEKRLVALEAAKTKQLEYRNAP